MNEIKPISNLQQRLQLNHTSRHVLFAAFVCLTLMFPDNTQASSSSSFRASPNFTNQANPYSVSPYRPANDIKIVNINSVHQLYRELDKANKTGNISLTLEDGVYQIERTLAILADNISLVSKSGDPEKSKITNAW